MVVLNARDAAWETLEGNGTWLSFEADGVQPDRRRLPPPAGDLRSRVSTTSREAR